MATLAAPFDIPQKAGDEIRIQAAAVQNYRGGAAAIALGTGYATPLVVSTTTHQFIGVYLEGNDNRNGVAGTLVEGAPLTGYSSWVRIARTGIFAFNQTGITQAFVGRPVFFSDDNTVTTTPGAVYAGIVVSVDENASVAWVDISDAVRPVSLFPQSVVANGTLTGHQAGTWVFNGTAAKTITLTAPTGTTDDGKVLTIISNSSFANVVTGSGLILDGSSVNTTATFTALAGAGIQLMAYQGKYLVLSKVNITVT